MRQVYLSCQPQLYRSAEAIVPFLAEDNMVICSTPSFADVNAGTKTFALIDDADIIIAVFGDETPSSNAMLEIGYSIGKGKPVAIVVTKSNKAVPFSMAALPMFFLEHESGLASLREFVNSIPTAARHDHRVPSVRERLIRIAQSPKEEDDITSNAFQDLIANYFETHGRSTGAHIVQELNELDMIVYDREANLKCAVEVKKLPRQSFVGIGDVLRLAKSFEHFTINLGVYITTGRFTDSAYDFTKRSIVPLKLFTLDDFLKIPTDRLMETLWENTSTKANANHAEDAAE